MARLIPKEVLELFEYRDGNLYYKNGGTGHYRNGGIAGSNHNNGYVRVKVLGRRWPAHRIIWEMHHGQIPEGMFIDHINRIRYDNRLENLRLATNQTNQFNNTAKNISWCRQTKTWKVCVMVDGHQIGTKRFLCFGEAHKYREKLRGLRFAG